MHNSLTDFIKHADSSTDGGLHEYGYDSLNRLISATHPLPQQPFNPNESFSYDPVGNRLSDIQNPASSISYNVANRIEEDVFYIYEFDANGNMVSKTEKATGKVTSFIYDPENQLIRIDFPDGTWATYRYDGLERRFEKNVNGVITRYVYDNEDILLEYDANNNLVARYTHGLGVDEPLVMERGGTSYFYEADGLGSISQLTDSTGAVVQSYIYNSFGKIVKQTGTLINPYTYTGREYDQESGLHYYRARYYDPNSGRFLQEDPVGLAGGINFYIYCNNSPLDLIDAFGLQRLTKEDYDKIKALYEHFQDVGNRLEVMWQNWESGQTWKDYGLMKLADAAGYRSPEFNQYPQAFQSAVNEIETNWVANWTQASQLATIGGHGYWNPLNWIFRRSGYAESQWWLTKIAIERFRNRWLLSKLQKILEAGATGIQCKR